MTVCAQHQLVLVETAAGFVFEDIADITEWPHASSRQRSVDVARAQQVQGPRTDITCREGDLARPLSLDADRTLHRVWRLQVRRDATNGLGHTEARKRCDWRRNWTQSQDRSAGRSR